MLLSIFLCVAVYFNLCLAASLPRKPELLDITEKGKLVAPRQATPSSTSTRPADAQCTNGPFTRQCWGNGYSIATNYDKVWPTTGKIVHYEIEVHNQTMSLDGYSRVVYAINGRFPGPTLRASWGDILEVRVTNLMTTNGTSIHWHGLRQYLTNHMDGTNGVTECPLAPGKSRTYRFLCTQFGTTWFHSHYSDQYSDGVMGTIIIDGPATSNYDIDLGTYPITDWYYRPAFELAPLLQSGALRGPPPGNNILINGTNVNINGTAGQYSRVSLTRGRKYRLRLINTSTNDNFQVGLDGHNFTVITADFVPIVPYSTKWIVIGIGERYDVIINANQAVDSYYFHVVPQTGCSNNLNKNAVSIFTYAGANSTTPLASTRNNVPPTTDCSNPNSKLVPYVKLDVPSNFTIPASSRLDVGFAIVQNQGLQNLVQWNLNFTAIQVPWGKPTLRYVLDGNTTYEHRMNLISLPRRDEWSFWVIQAIPTIAPPQPHPMHLHGHDFYVLGADSGVFNNSQTLNYINPPRRDTAMLPANGYLVIAFITDNPGAWLFHCHIAWHIGLGLGAQFLERADAIPGLGIGPDFQQQCDDWNRYYETAPYDQHDSGL